MNKKSLPERSKAGHDILRIIRKAGKQTVREAHDQLQSACGGACTTGKIIMVGMGR